MIKLKYLAGYCEVFSVFEESPGSFWDSDTVFAFSSVFEVSDFFCFGECVINCVEQHFGGVLTCVCVGNIIGGLILHNLRYELVHRRLNKRIHGFHRISHVFKAYELIYCCHRHRHIDSRPTQRYRCVVHNPVYTCRFLPPLGFWFIT